MQVADEFAISTSNSEYRKSCGTALRQPVCRDTLPASVLQTVTSQGTNRAHQPVCQQPWERDNHCQHPQGPSSCGQLMLQGRQRQQLHNGMQAVNIAVTGTAFVTPQHIWDRRTALHLYTV